MCIWTIWTYHIRWFLVPIETIESANESGNCNVFQEGVTCTVCARLNSGRMGELRAPFEVLQAIIFVHFYYSNSMRFFCTHRIGWYVVSEVYTLWDNCRSDQNTQLISPPPSGKQLRLHGDHMEKLAAIVVWLVVLYWTTDLNALSLTRGFQITQKTWGANCVK